MVALPRPDGTSWRRWSPWSTAVTFLVDGGLEADSSGGNQVGQVARLVSAAGRPSSVASQPCGDLPNNDRRHRALRLPRHRHPDAARRHHASCVKCLNHVQPVSQHFACRERLIVIRWPLSLQPLARVATFRRSPFTPVLLLWDASQSSSANS